MKNIKIYVMAHRAFQAPENKIYIPLQVGTALHDDLGYVRDDSGDNISEKNPYYSELTGFYWMWKNAPDCDITGLCHYRRFFLDENKELLSGDKIEHILQVYDMIVSGIPVLENDASVYDHYAKYHHGKDLDRLREVVAEHSPEYLDVYDEVLQGQQMYFSNMLIARKEVVDAYAKWLFHLLFAMEDKIDLSEYNDYDKRIFGFLSERLLLVWIRKNGLRACSMEIGLFADKADTEEIFAQAISILKSGKQKEVLEYLHSVEKKRPDVFGCDSDREGVLLQVRLIAELMDAEERMGKSSLKNYSTDFYELQGLLKELVKDIKQLPSDGRLYQLIVENGLSAECMIVFINMLVDEKTKKITICNYLANEALNVGQIEIARVYLSAAMLF